MSKHFIRNYLFPRLLQYGWVIFFGITVTFFIPRLAGQDPVIEMVSRIRSQGAFMSPKEIERVLDVYRELFGLKGTLFEQYVTMWRRICRFDFGPSFLQYPTPVSDLLRLYLPWTIGLLFTSALLAWIFGNIIGGVAGYFPQKYYSKLLEAASMVLRPIPYYIFGILVLLLFAYVWKLFPLGGGGLGGRKEVFNWSTILSILYHSFLPALTLVILSGASWFQQMRLLVQNTKNTDYVQYAKAGGVKDRIIFFRYVFSNALLPQITQFALLFGTFYSGTLIIETVFSYPGMGLLLYRALTKGDFNLVMAIIVLSVFTTATAVLILDLLYPLFDPRIRHR